MSMKSNPSHLVVLCLLAVCSRRDLGPGRREARCAFRQSLCCTVAISEAEKTGDFWNHLVKGDADLARAVGSGDAEK